MATCIGEEENLCGNVRHLVNGLEVQIIHLTLRTSWILQLRGYFSGRVRHTDVETIGLKEDVFIVLTVPW